MDLDRVAAVVDPLLVEAADVAGSRFRSGLIEIDKGGARGYDPVTEADRQTEEILRSGLTAAFPESQVEGEEGGVTGPDGASVRWIIDPIDGTKAYVMGMPAWGVQLGLVVDGRPVAGWMRQPWLDETFAAVSGTGWYTRGPDRRPLATRPTKRLGDARMATTHPGMFGGGPDEAAYLRLAGAVQLSRFGGDCYSYGLLALGFVDLVVEAGLRSYDIVPLVPIVEAAGGVVTDRSGAVPIEGGLVVAAATPDLHAAALSYFSGG